MPSAFRSRLGATGSGKRFSVFRGDGVQEAKGAGGMSRMAISIHALGGFLGALGAPFASLFSTSFFDVDVSSIFSRFGP